MPCPLPQQDRYWRLDDYCTTTAAKLQEFLRAAGVKVRRDACKSDFIKEMHRLAKGELSKFIKDRGIKWPMDSMKREGLIAALEKTDDEATFERFLDLPPELRERVAMFCTAELVSPLYKTDGIRRRVCMPGENEKEQEEQTLDHPTQPPLSMTCRLLRQETLPLFYKTCTFDMHFSYNHHYSKNGATPSCQLLPKHSRWLKAIGSENIKLLRNLRIGIEVFSSYNFMYQLGAGKPIFCLFHNLEKVKRGDHILDRFLEGLNQVLEAVRDREGPSKFRLECVEAMRRAIEKAIWRRFSSIRL